MRYAVTTLLVLGLGITAMASVAFAQTNVLPSFTQYGNQIAPLEPDDGSGGLVAEADGCWVYTDGVAYSCTQPTPMTMPTPSGSGGVAGGSIVCPVFGPCYEPQYKLDGGDRN
jgi:hypothetical protein